MVAAQPVRPPLKLEDFLWNMHSTLVATGPLGLDQLKDAYSKQMGHKCVIERFLVVGDGGLAATLKRIPHIVTLVPSDGGGTSVRASQPPDINRQQLIEADQAFRRDLQKKNAAAKAKANAKAAAAIPKAGGAASPPAGAPDPAASPPATDGQAKRPAEGSPPGAGDPKKPRPDSTEAETLARMLVQGVVRVLQNRTKAGKGPLPMSELEEEFKALWKVPFNLQQAGETDAVTFLQKWPSKVELYHDGSQHMVLLSKKGQEKAKATEAVPAAAKGPAAGQSSPTAAAPAAVPGVSLPVPPKPAAPTGATAAKQPPPAAKVPSTVAAAAKSPTAVTTATKAPAAVAAAAGGAAAAKPAAEGAPAAAKSASGPARPPATVEDFLWNIHTVIDAHGGPMPLDQLKDAYSKHLGHKCAIERFLVVGDGGLAATLRRIPHVVVVAADKDGSVTLKAALPPGTTKEQLIAADHQYRRQLQQRNSAAKARQVPATAPAKGSPPAAGATPAAASAAAPAAAPAVAAPAGAAAAPAPAAAAGAPAGAAPTAPAGEKRPADGPAAGDAKRPRPEDADTLARMLVQGIVRVLQNRQRDSKGPLPVNSLEEEFKALWKVPFNLAQAGETDTVTFLQKWQNKVEVVTEGGQTVVQLAKKAAEKAKAAGGPPPGGSGPTLPLSPDAEAKKASPAVAPAAAKTGAAAVSPAAAAAGPPPPAATAASTGLASALPPPTAAAASPNSSPAAAGRSAAGVSKEVGKAARASPRTGGDDEQAPAATAPAEEPAAVEAVECTQAPERGLQTLPELCEEAESMMQMMQEMLRKQQALVSSLRRLSADQDAVPA